MVILVIILVILVGIAVFLWIRSRKKEGRYRRMIRPSPKKRKIRKKHRQHFRIRRTG